MKASTESPTVIIKSPQDVLLIFPKAPIMTTEAPIPIMKFLAYLNEADLIILFMLVEMLLLLND
jgi:hypothetical protein